LDKEIESFRAQSLLAKKKSVKTPLTSALKDKEVESSNIAEKQFKQAQQRRDRAQAMRRVSGSATLQTNIPLAGLFSADREFPILSEAYDTLITFGEDPQDSTLPDVAVIVQGEKGDNMSTLYALPGIDYDQLKDNCKANAISLKNVITLLEGKSGPLSDAVSGKSQAFVNKHYRVFQLITASLLCESARKCSGDQNDLGYALRNLIVLIATRPAEDSVAQRKYHKALEDVESALLNLSAGIKGAAGSDGKLYHGFEGVADKGKRPDEIEQYKKGTLLAATEEPQGATLADFVDVNVNPMCGKGDDLHTEGAFQGFYRYANDWFCARYDKCIEI
jgi:hypothetical protein